MTILARLESMDNRLSGIEEKVESLTLQKATSDGEARALARIGGYTLLILSGVGSLFAWVATGGGGDWLRNHLK